MHITRWLQRHDESRVRPAFPSTSNTDGKATAKASAASSTALTNALKALVLAENGHSNFSFVCDANTPSESSMATSIQPPRGVRCSLREAVSVFFHHKLSSPGSQALQLRRLNARKRLQRRGVVTFGTTDDTNAKQQHKKKYSRTSADTRTREHQGRRWGERHTLIITPTRPHNLADRIG